MSYDTLKFGSKTYSPLLTETVDITRANGVEPGRFITKAGVYPVAGGTVLGVIAPSGSTSTTPAIANKDSAAVITKGTALLEAGGVIAQGAKIATTATGKALTAAGVNTVLGTARGLTTASGELVLVSLTI